MIVLLPTWAFFMRATNPPISLLLQPECKRLVTAGASRISLHPLRQANDIISWGWNWRTLCRHSSEKLQLITTLKAVFLFFKNMPVCYCQFSLPLWIFKLLKIMASLCEKCFHMHPGGGGVWPVFMPGRMPHEELLYDLPHTPSRRDATRNRKLKNPSCKCNLMLTGFLDATWTHRSCTVTMHYPKVLDQPFKSDCLWNFISYSPALQLR